jgi:peroxiredoxin
MDKAVTQAEFKASLDAPYPFIADASGELTRLYDAKLPILPIAKRTTFVIGQAGLIQQIVEGSDAIDPSVSIGACSLAKGPH